MTEKEVLEIIEQAAKDGQTKLDLSGMRIESLPGEIGKLTKLTVLDLGINRLISVPAELLKLTNLTELHLYTNKLTSVCAELGELTKLTKLILASNQITSVPAELGKLTNLIWLDLSGNQLTSVPAELGGLPELEMLYLGGNELRDISGLMGLRKVRGLILRKNQISELPRGIVDLGIDIQWEYELDKHAIFLEDNPLESPPVEVVKLGTEAVREWFDALEDDGGLQSG